jgi:ABC-type phosphate/phosphonate transport system permease subunit
MPGIVPSASGDRAPESGCAWNVEEIRQDAAMKMKEFFRKLWKHPLGALYGTLQGVVAFWAAVPMFASGMWEAALVDLAMAGILIGKMLKVFVSIASKRPGNAEKWIAWGLLLLVNLLALLPAHSFPGSLSTAFAFSLLICAFVR